MSSFNNTNETVSAVKTEQEIQKEARLRNILNEVRYIRVQLEAIEKEANKGLEHDFFCGPYIAEKTHKAQSGLDEINKDINFSKRRMY